VSALAVGGIGAVELIIILFVLGIPLAVASLVIWLVLRSR